MPDTVRPLKMSDLLLYMRGVIKKTEGQERKIKKTLLTRVYSEQVAQPYI